MTTEESLLAAILDQPADDTARLVYADYLDGDAEPREPERAELIREMVGRIWTTYARRDQYNRKSPHLRFLNDLPPVWDEVAIERGFICGVEMPSPRGLADLLRSWPIEAVTVGTLSFRVLSPACPRQSFPGTWGLDEVGGQPRWAQFFSTRAGLVAGIEDYLAATLRGRALDELIAEGQALG